ncbi:hypothetical protein L1987_60126 [Smallanthus sonchifolius]|uniref:Uncharacterized protein n=1 Tax=Smallanthus sonchifolius TaxID=185202 RepID=A0ACB9D765_9ASTR|nr:hypothetical protein L1987_60126 [Smallanthus sonchifolius]
MAIYDTMQSLQSLIGTHCVGDAYNLAGFLLAAGEKLENMNKFKDHVSREIIHIPDKAPFPPHQQPAVKVYAAVIDPTLAGHAHKGVYKYILVLYFILRILTGSQTRVASPSIRTDMLYQNHYSFFHRSILGFFFQFLHKDEFGVTDLLGNALRMVIQGLFGILPKPSTSLRLLLV